MPEFLSYGSDPAGKFVTNVGLITSNGPNGYDIMAAEWTHHISYEPSLIQINLHKKDATTENIIKTGEFGVSIASDDQNTVASIAGNSTGKEVDKVALLKEFGAALYKAEKIDAYMVEGAVLNAECKVLYHKDEGDHVLFVGRVVAGGVNNDKKPLLYSGGRYFKVGERIMKPAQSVLDDIKKLREKYRK